jgi:hypothetical protein
MHMAIECTYAQVYFTTYRSMLLHTAMGSLSGGVAFTTYRLTVLCGLSKLFNKNICAPQSDPPNQSPWFYCFVWFHYPDLVIISSSLRKET